MTIVDIGAVANQTKTVPTDDHLIVAAKSVDVVR